MLSLAGHLGYEQTKEDLPDMKTQQDKLIQIQSEQDELDELKDLSLEIEQAPPIDPHLKSQTKVQAGAAKFIQPNAHHDNTPVRETV
jgi:hypothetical protein